MTTTIKKNGITAEIEKGDALNFDIRFSAPTIWPLNNHVIQRRGNLLYIGYEGKTHAAKFDHVLQRLENWFDVPSPYDVQKAGERGVFLAGNIAERVFENPESIHQIYLDLVWDLREKPAEK